MKRDKTFHFNHKFGKVQPDGYQYCGICGKAEAAPKKDCWHNWETIKKMNVLGVFDPSAVVGYAYIQQCSNCGELKKFKVNSW